MSVWIGVDLDGTLAEYYGWPVDGSIGAPIPAMVERVKAWLAEGQDVRIFTARIFPIGTNQEFVTTPDRWRQALDQANMISAWCGQHFGRSLPVTCVKDYGMIELWDDRAIQVEPNTGRPVAPRPTP